MAIVCDNYSFIGHNGAPSSLTSNVVAGFSVDSSLGKGLQTGSATAYFNEKGIAGYTFSAIYYDSRYNVAQVVSTNHLGRCDITSTNYSYTGKPTNMLVNHNLRTRGEKEYYTYTYDDADRLSKVTHKVDNGSEQILQQNSYNSLGQLVSTSNGIFATSYTYDIHSWLKSISTRNQSALFEENLKYADSEHPCYNGNISAMTWKNSGASTQKYNFTYDDASRLVSASYSVANNSDRYSTRYSYDCMGNITSLRRNGHLDDGSYGLIDNLKLTYDGNQLKAVSDDGDDPTNNNAWNFMDGADSAKEYEYDANGNVTKDLNRNILSIQYNSLNLPSMIKFADDKTIKYTKYTYSADGRKLRAVYTTVTPATSKQVDYCGNLIFENGQLKQMLVDGGYIPMDDWSGAYRFYVKDHLGNNRIRMVMHEYYGAEQMNNYYPYGGLMSNSTGWNAQRFKYNGKEFDRMHGLDWYDYGARWMDPALGRWHSMDPLSEKYYNVSPYVYCMNNPVNAFDPDGNLVLFINGKIGGGSPPAGPLYWNCKYGKNGNPSTFVSRAQTFFNDNNIDFSNVDYSYLSTADSRRKFGYNYARQNYEKWTSNMKEGESFKLVSHSMGSAFSMGIEDYIKDQGREVEYNVMINAYQIDHINIDDNSKTLYIDYQNTNDPVLFWFDDNCGKGKLKKADITIREHSDSAKLSIHRSPINSGDFWKTIMQYVNEFFNTCDM